MVKNNAFCKLNCSLKFFYRHRELWPTAFPSGTIHYCTLMEATSLSDLPDVTTTTPSHHLGDVSSPLCVNEQTRETHHTDNRHRQDNDTRV